ncbi:hypothetical protein [Mangrovibacter phragmitis]|uniref:hypothetical protein n=1 Tax=Mangrovibacter phragmitis TaxID=1691903 RepID=UPI00336A961D
MRTYGRDKNGKWVEITTDDNGYNDMVLISNLIQNLRLAPGESPFYANNGIPAQSSVIQQILPTYYVNRLQQQFSQYFSSLQIAMVSDDPPVYNVSVITNSGAKIITEVYS